MTGTQPSHIPLVIEVLAVYIQPAVDSIENLVGAGVSARSTTGQPGQSLAKELNSARRKDPKSSTAGHGIYGRSPITLTAKFPLGQSLS